MSLFPADLRISLALGLGMLTCVPLTPAGSAFLEQWPGYDGEALTLDSSYARGIESEGKAEGLIVETLTTRKP